MTEEREQGGDVLSSRHRRLRSLRATFRVDEIRARSTPQLVALVGGMATLATGFFWTTISQVRAGAPFDWRLPAALLVDLVVVVCLPGVVVAGGEVIRRLRHLLTTDDDGPLLTRCARAAARFTAQARTDTGDWFDSLDTRLVLIMLIAPPLNAALGVLVVVDGIRYGWTSDVRVLVVIGAVALVLVPLSVPAALGSLRRRRRGRPE
ncbi:hypothetical protein ACQEVI_25065 [Promicromonospora sp. CA-289599]|uniref:hypothetical protein n=1 Tax=Promicromonospora sp. CA-289599 TaxID=3240014 RepID=UPI003D9098B9